MTVEEIEIIVTAKVEEALKEFQKMLPAIKEKVKQVQEAFEEGFKNIDTKTITNKINQAVQIVKKKLQNLKKSNSNNEIRIHVNNKEASKQIDQIQKEIDSLQQKINARQLQLNITNGALDKIREDTKQGVIRDMPNAGAKRTSQQTELRLATNDNYQSLIVQSDKLNNEIIRYNMLLESAKSKMTELGTTQNKLSSFFNIFKTKMQQLEPVISSLRKKIEATFNHLKGKASDLGNNVKLSLGQIIKYAGALFGLRSIYNVLRNCSSSWLNSQNAGVQQLKANIDYMKYAMRKCICTNHTMGY
jgi:chromosome segregation ATPase